MNPLNQFTGASEGRAAERSDLVKRGCVSDLITGRVAVISDQTTNLTRP